MPASRRSMLAAAGAGLASLGIASATGGSGRARAASGIDTEVAELIRRSADSNAALMRGDVDGYRASDRACR